MVRGRKFGLIAAILLVAGAAPLMRSRADDPMVLTGPAGPLSVMTYNVHGLPWPVAWGREDALASIGARLHALRQIGRQPHIVALQEAFTDDAKAIGRIGGYRYIVSGPSDTPAANIPYRPDDGAYLRGRRWSRGEGVGKLVDSGLMILSDYPIVRVRRGAFPDFACAGFDCLANKGVLLVSVAVPGADVPVEIVNTHLNSRRASGVSYDRANHAYLRQVEMLTRFVAAERDPRSPLIMAGDFNMGQTPLRRLMLLGAIRGMINPQSRLPVRDGLSSCVGGGGGADARWILAHGRDWQFMSDGSAAAIEARRATVSFGRDADGEMLSDHMGFSVDYRLARS